MTYRQWSKRAARKPSQNESACDRSVPRAARDRADRTWVDRDVALEAYAREIRRLVRGVGERGEPDQYSGKRGWTRFKEGMQLDVTMDPGLPSASWPVYVHNISEGEFAFWSKKQVPLQTPIFVREHSGLGPNSWLPAEVTHCTAGIRECLIDAAFDEARLAHSAA